MKRLLWLIPILWCGLAHGQTWIQNCTSHPSNATNPATCTFGSTVGTGHLIVGSIRTATTTNSINQSTGVSDSGGSSYSYGTALTNSSISGGMTEQMFYTCNSVGHASDTISIPMTNADSNIYVAIMEFSGVATSSCLDNSATGASGGATESETLTSNSYQTNNATDLLIGCADTGATGVLAAGGNNHSGTYTLGAVSSNVNGCEYMNVSVTNTTYEAIMTDNALAYWTMDAFAFKAATATICKSCDLSKLEYP